MVAGIREHHKEFPIIIGTLEPNALHALIDSHGITPSYTGARGSVSDYRRNNSSGRAQYFSTTQALSALLKAIHADPQNL
jgi:hypothetical protein